MTRSTYRSVHLLGPEMLELRSLRRQQPGEGELVVAIDAATTCGTDVKVFQRGGHPRMLRPPCPFGHEMAGTIQATGRGVHGWSEGDRVVIANSASCGKCGPCREGRENLCDDLLYLNGAFADEIRVPRRFVERSLYRIPANLPSVMAALSEPLACVVHAWDQMNLADHRRVLVIGGGPIGLMFVFLLAGKGHDVTMADPHDNRLDMARELGASAGHRIIHRKSPLGALPPGDIPVFDVTIDATGSVAGWTAAVDAAKPGGSVCFFGGCAPGTEITLDTQRIHYQELALFGTYHHRPAAFARALERIAATPQALASLITYETGLRGVRDALGSMIGRSALKVAILPSLD